MTIYGKNHCQSQSGLQAGCWGHISELQRQKLDEVRRCTKDRLPAHLGGGGWGGNHHLLGTLSVSHSHLQASKTAPGHTVRFLLPALCASLLTGGGGGGAGRGRAPLLLAPSSKSGKHRHWEEMKGPFCGTSCGNEAMQHSCGWQLRT